MADLSGVHAKFDRACGHAKAFDAAAAKVLDPQPYFVTHERESDGWYVLRWTVKGRPDLSAFPLIFGDMLTNLRATLDYIVWQLVLVNGQPPSERNAFPVVKNSANWASAVGDRLQGVDPIWIDEIRRLQPFDQGHTGQPERHLLTVLDAVNNLNKHRLLSIAFATLEGFKFGVEFPPESPEVEIIYEAPMVLGAPIEDRAVGIRLRTEPPIDFQVRVDRYPTIRITFRDGMDHSDGWGYTNGDLIDWVRRAIAVFEPAFAS